MQISIAEFKARNAEAQQINAEIQKAQGAIEENKRQFAKLCADYEAQFGEKVDETNIESILARVTAEVQAQADAQAAAIAQAKAGIVITVADTPASTAPAATEVPTAPTPAAQTVTAAPEAPAPAFVAPTPTPVAPTPVAPAPAAPTVMAGVQASQANPFAAPVMPTVPQTETEEPQARPVSAASLSMAAIQQSNNAETLDMTQQINATQQQAAPAPSFSQVNIPGWNLPNPGAVDFNAMLGGAFGGGNK